MKIFFVLFFSVLFSLNLLSQTIDTVYTIDTLVRNDTIFLVKTRHIRIIIPDKSIKSKKFKVEPSIEKNIVPKYFPVLYREKSAICDFTGFYPFINWGAFHNLGEYSAYPDTNLFPLTVFNMGINTAIRYKNINLLTGMSVEMFIEQAKLNESWYEINSRKEQQINTIYSWNIDTVWFLNLDSLLNGDTVYTPYYDSNLIVSYDTVFVTKYDTLNYKLSISNVNLIAKINIPLLYEYNFRINKSMYKGRVGIKYKILIYKKFIIPKLHNHQIQEIYFLKNNISFYTEILKDIKVSKHNKLSTGLYIDLPLISDIYFNQLSRYYPQLGFSLTYYFKEKK